MSPFFRPHLLRRDTPARLAAARSIYKWSVGVASNEGDEVNLNFGGLDTRKAFYKFYFWNWTHAVAVHFLDNPFLVGIFPVKLFFMPQPAVTFSKADIERRAPIFSEQGVDVMFAGVYFGVRHLGGSFARLLRGSALFQQLPGFATIAQIVVA